MATISVIMGIYNCSSTLPQAIDSILTQTFTDWELIMCDDGSTDNTYAVAEEYVHRYPEKIRLIRNEHNRGLSVSLNRCLALAEGEYIARMDGDDISAPERFEKELSFLRQHPEYSIVSTDMDLFDEHGIWGRTHSAAEPTVESMVSGPPHCHAACLVKREAYTAVGGYSEAREYERVEDRNLWFKMYKAGFRGANLQEPLYMMRDDRNATSRRKLKYRFHGAYVGMDVIKGFQLSPLYFLKAIRPIMIGLLPRPVYRFLHKRKRQS